MAMITEPEAFFARGCGRCERFDTADCSALRWAGGLAELRRICLACGLTETAKWGHPCYMHAGRNIAIVGAFRRDFRLTFFNAALLADPAGVMQRQGANTQHPDMLSFANDGGPTELEPVIRAYLAEAMAYAEEGRLPPKREHDLDLPAEMIEALDADIELAEAFAALTPGRQRSYAIVLGQAKKSETRIARIAKLRGKIIAGKGANKY